MPLLHHLARNTPPWCASQGRSIGLDKRILQPSARQETPHSSLTRRGSLVQIQHRPLNKFTGTHTMYEPHPPLQTLEIALELDPR